ncbi:MAG: adenine phosphoribosyltransferase [Candidatus Omnitrophica bacterium]|nr:adenine phosphoribosyltransferase [Candidatus Omnitrophota bacterium]MBU1046993.1 adenine phosphoribosyltransferase [Candidatus Omnitrophota bacterium]MBU1767270.1 adenine phosphoribosyltransferase [Candidatus Omnitrophota bacterium]MBU1889539.1 adenine phosphoribosyltransferase [Candidatus Omnitrophota bacterium]
MKDLEILKSAIRDVPDFPKKGIIFKDITPVLKDGKLFSLAVENMTEPFRKQKIDSVVAIEARGFIFGAAIASVLNCGMVPVRKQDKLPYKTHSVNYALEYGTDTLEIHIDAVNKGENVLVVDDLLATGGTAQGVCELIEKSGGNIIGISFLIELAFLNGRKRLGNYPIHCVLQL